MTLRDDLMELRLLDMSAMACELKGEALGIDPNTLFKTHPEGIKGGMADWIMAEYTNARIRDALPKYLESTRRYREAAGNRPRANIPRPQMPPIPSPIDPVPPPPPRIAGDYVLKVEFQQYADKAARELSDMCGGLDAQGKRIDNLTERLDVLEAAKRVVVEVRRAEAVETTELGPQHVQFETLLRLAGVRRPDGTALNIWITGPAGSGKTRAATTVAKALKLPFHFTGAVDNEYKLLGFIDAQGRTVRTAFREAYEHGGVFLLDEVDGCHASAVLALNAALANGMCDFPDGTVVKHADCIIMATANTWGTGATHDYIGRTKLDSASLDRFVSLAWPYDEDLELSTSGNIDWCKKVQKMRAKCEQAGVRHIISPRATYDGAALLAAGMEEETVAAMLVRRGLSDSEWAKIKV